MKLNFKQMFPYQDSPERLEGHCKFYFQNDSVLLQECLDYLRQENKAFYNKNDFAKKACQSNPSYECCKKYAKDNDIAYEICTSSVEENKHAYNHNIYIIIGIIISIFILIVFIKLFLFKY